MVSYNILHYIFACLAKIRSFFHLFTAIGQHDILYKSTSQTTIQDTYGSYVLKRMCVCVCVCVYVLEYHFIFTCTGVSICTGVYSVYACGFVAWRVCVRVRT